MRIPSVTLIIGLLFSSCGPVHLDPRVLASVEDQRLEHSRELLRALRRGDHETRLRAIRAASRIQSPTLIAPLAALTTDKLPATTRSEALFALGQLGLAEGMTPAIASDATNVVVAALDDDDDRVVVAAVEALGKLAPDDAAAALIPFLHHANAGVRAEAATALFRLRFAPQWRKQSDSPPPLSRPAVEALAAAFDDLDPTVRWTAAHALSRFGEPTAISSLVELLDDPHPWARLFATRAISRSKDRASATHLLRVVSDSSDAVRVEAVTGLAALEAIDSVSLDALAGGSHHVRAAVATALATSTEPATLDRLNQLARDASPSVRCAASDALAKRRGAAHAPALLRTLAHAEWPERVAAARAARHAGDAARGIVEAALDDRDHRVQAAALSLLDELEFDGASALVRTALESPDLAVRGTALEVVAARNDPAKLSLLEGAWSRSSGDDWIELRESAVDAIAGLADNPDATALLRKIARDDDAASVSQRAVTALAKRGVEVERNKPSTTTASPFLDVNFARDPIVILETDRGDLTIRCLAEDAPIHVASFVDLVKKGIYDGLPWHRVVPSFVIQGGDPRGDGWGGPGYNLRDEINRQRFVRGAVGMPKAGKDTGGCQIFITHLPTPHLDGNYTIFGLVTAGFDVIDRIEVGDLIRRARLVDDGAPAPIETNR